MTIVVDVPPEVQAELARQAPAKDMVELFAPLHGLNIDFERSVSGK